MNTRLVLPSADLSQVEIIEVLLLTSDRVEMIAQKTA